VGILAQKKVLLLCSAGSFLAGLVVGGFFGVGFFSSPPPPATLPLLDLLKEAHRLLDQGRFPDAERAYQNILGRDIGNPEALTHLGNIAFQKGDAERALSYYDEALRRDPAYAHALWDKGIALQGKGDDAGAIAAWEAFARLYPPDSSDVVTVKKWIAEAQARPGSGRAPSVKPDEMIRKLSKISEAGASKDKSAK
jgi:tetratricopeptide (TPR) repeat protein